MPRARALWVGPGGGDQGERFIRAGMIGTQTNRMPLPGLEPKDEVGIPWRVAFALQADGWYLRSDIIWAKPNPMPESVTDRPTKSHEYLFLLAKSERYYFDSEARGRTVGDGKHRAPTQPETRRAARLRPSAGQDERQYEGRDPLAGHRSKARHDEQPQERL